MPWLKASLLCSNIYLPEFYNNKVKGNGITWSIKDRHEKKQELR